MERTFTARTELKAILLEQALIMVRELEAVSEAAADGEILAVAVAAENEEAPAGPARAADAAPSRTRRPGRS